jgi:acetyl-CoA carboxylase carboxyl transferase subunit beta
MKEGRSRVEEDRAAVTAADHRGAEHLMAVRARADELIGAVLDAGSFVSWDEPVPLRGDESYRADLLRAREKTGIEESVVTGSGRLAGHPVAVIAGEFAFLGGSIGADSAFRVADAIARATAEGLPVLAAPVSGGTRMQEGTSAFVQMITITGAVDAHRRAGLPYLVYLRDPTTGGVFASWGSLGHLTAAEPGALIGFLGPRVYEAIHGKPFPEGVQRAEHLYEHGLVDAVIDAGHLRSLLEVFLEAWTSRSAVAATAPMVAADPPSDDWASVTASRDHTRPGLRSVLQHSTIRPIRLSGTGRGEADRSLTLAIARFGGYGVVVVGHDRRVDEGVRSLTPGGLRVVERGIRLAEELRMPLVTVIDTAGAELSAAAEEGGLAGEIARSLMALIAVEVPTVSVVLGQGGGGGALALLPADRILATEDAWLAPLPPEGASAIVFRDTEHAPSIARSQRIGAAHLLEDGIVDTLIGAGSDLAAATADAIGAAIAEVSGSAPADLIAARRNRFRRAAGQRRTSDPDHMQSNEGNEGAV